MTSIIETTSTAFLLILLVLLILHMINGTASQWISSKFKVAGTTTLPSPFSGGGGFTGEGGGSGGF